VYQRDAQGNIALTIVGDDVTYVVLHEAGTPVLDGSGNPVFKHLIGDIKLDPDGNPIVLSSRTLVHQLDLFLVDGVYWFATATGAATYRETIPSTVVGWVNGNIAEVSKYLLERTELFFYPKSTLGQVSAIVLDGQVMNVPAAQSFSVSYYLRGAAHRDTSLRKALETTAIETINSILQKPVVTMSEIIDELREKTRSDAIGFQVTGLGGTQPLDTITLQDDSARLSIRKIAVPLADGTITVQDDVNVEFVKHTAD
jgi:hypothetical protein